MTTTDLILTDRASLILSMIMLFAESYPSIFQAIAEYEKLMIDENETTH